MEIAPSLNVGTEAFSTFFPTGSGAGTRCLSGFPAHKGRKTVLPMP